MMPRKVSHSSTYSGLDSFLCGGKQMQKGGGESNQGRVRRIHADQKGGPQQHVLGLGKVPIISATKTNAADATATFTCTSGSSCSYFIDSNSQSLTISTPNQSSSAPKKNLGTYWTCSQHRCISNWCYF